MTDFVMTIYSDDEVSEESDEEFGFEGQSSVSGNQKRNKKGNIRISKMIQEDRDEKKKTTTAKEKIKKLLMRKRKYEGKKEEEQEEEESEEEESTPKTAEEIFGPNRKIQKIEQQNTKSWGDLKLIKPILRAINDLGFKHPTNIQEMAIPVLGSGRDVLASSVTGSGKTAAFLIPIIQRYFKVKYNLSLGNYTKALIILPTRELAIQCYQMFQALNKYTNLTSCIIFGQASIQAQESDMRKRPDLVISTPGRLIDILTNSKNVDLDDLEMLIFDEADKLLDLGFKNEIEQIVGLVSQRRQTMLFSATLDKGLKKIVKLALDKPVRIQANPDNRVASHLRQEVVRLADSTLREAALLHLLDTLFKKRVLIFCKTKRQCHRLAIILGLKAKRVCELHGNLTQTERFDAFEKFKEGEYDIMIATDLASRGLDIKGLRYVINFELPQALTRYIHRVGRTARAGNSGVCVTLLDDYEFKKFKTQIKKVKEKIFARKINVKKLELIKEKIEEYEYDVRKIIDQERIEREIRLAEMEVKKAQNMITYREEIYSRPKREWFMSNSMKNKIQEEAKKAALGDEYVSEPKKKLKRR